MSEQEHESARAPNLKVPTESAGDQPPKAEAHVPLAMPVDLSVPSRVQESQGHQSVFDEPDIFPGRQAEVIKQDWSCSECGYNLRGLPAGHRCPECGHVELYRPPPPGAVSYASWYREKKASVTAFGSWAAVGGITCLVGLLALISSAMILIPSVVMGGIMAPAVAESIKIGAIVWVADARPYLFKSQGQLLLCAVLCGLVYATIQNVLVYQAHGVLLAGSLTMLFWRWIGCSVLHAAFSLYAVSAIARAWGKADREHRRAAGRETLRPLVIVIACHVVINLMMHEWGLFLATF